MSMDTSWNLIWLILAIKVMIIGEFNVFAWIRYGREYRDWFFSRETFGEYRERIGKKKVGW